MVSESGVLWGKYTRTWSQCPFGDFDASKLIKPVANSQKTLGEKLFQTKKPTRFSFGDVRFFGFCCDVFEPAACYRCPQALRSPIPSSPMDVAALRAQRIANAVDVRQEIFGKTADGAETKKRGRKMLAKILGQNFLWCFLTVCCWNSGFFCSKSLVIWAWLAIPRFSSSHPGPRDCATDEPQICSEGSYAGPECLDLLKKTYENLRPLEVYLLFLRRKLQDGMNTEMMVFRDRLMVQKPWDSVRPLMQPCKKSRPLARLRCDNKKVIQS